MIDTTGTEFHGDTLEWQSNLEQLKTCPRPLHTWLSEPGLLTARLALLAKRDLRVEIINQEACLLDSQLLRQFSCQSPQAIARRVLLKNNTEDWVIAETLIPLALWESTRWLNQLGTKPLGQALLGAGVTELSHFEFAEVSAQSSLGQLTNVGAGQQLFARRRWHQINNARILIQEVFLPALIEKILP
jgi:chorismate-pyruvate lyase